MTLPPGTRVIAVAATLTLPACSPRHAEFALNTAAVPAATLVKRVEANEDRLRSMVGRGSMTFETPEVGGSAYFELSLKKPDSLLVRFEGPFGIDVGTLFLSRQKFVMYNSMENSVVTGVPSTRAIRSVIPFDLTYDQVLSAFAGSFPFTDARNEPLLYTIDDDCFLLSYRCGAHVCRYWIDPDWLLVTRYEVDDSLGVVMEASASHMTDDDGASAAGQITVRFPAERRQISIYYSSLELNAENPSFAFSIPSNARTIIR